MKRFTPMLMLLLAIAAIPVFTHASELEKILELKRLVDENEPKQKWKLINWQADIPSALKEAQKQNKPLLVFMLVNESGHKDAEHC